MELAISFTLAHLQSISITIMYLAVVDAGGGEWLTDSLGDRSEANTI